VARPLRIPPRDFSGPVAFNDQVTPRRLIEPARLAGSALLHTQSDERLVDLARAGNDRAFEAIAARYRRPLLRFCRRLLPPERAEDAVQQTFLNAYRAIGAGGGELNLRPWLYRIAHNASVSLLRQNGWSHEELDEEIDGVPQPPQEVEQSERLREVMRAVKDLPERQRNAVVLRELEGRTYEEIALALGVSGGAVRQLLSRARTNLRAAATALTPWPLAELCAGGAAGAGGLAVAAKLGTVIVVAGAVAGGTTGVGPLPGVVDGGDGRGGDEAVAAEADGPGAAGEALVVGNDEGPSGRSGEDDRSGHRDGDDDRSGRGGGEGDDDRSGPGDGEGDDDRSGPGDGDDDEDSSGPGSGDGDSDSSGSGSSGSGSGSSGPGSDGSGDDSDSSGSGSGSSGSGSSGGSGGTGSGGSGRSGSGSSGSGSDGSGADGGDSSGSGGESSGSGSGSSGAGSD
jgi:RNA polymerase sigma factor (sigma-70 family)